MHSADGWQEFLEPILRYYAGKGINVKVRGDAAFAIPGLYELCEEPGIDYAVRIKENEKLTEKAALYTKRPVGRLIKNKYLHQLRINTVRRVPFP